MTLNPFWAKFEESHNFFSLFQLITFHKIKPVYSVEMEVTLLPKGEHIL